MMSLYRKCGYIFFGVWQCTSHLALCKFITSRWREQCCPHTFGMCVSLICLHAMSNMCSADTTVMTEPLNILIHICYWYLMLLYADIDTLCYCMQICNWWCSDAQSCSLDGGGIRLGTLPDLILSGLSPLAPFTWYSHPFGPLHMILASLWPPAQWCWLSGNSWYHISLQPHPSPKELPSPIPCRDFVDEIRPFCADISDEPGDRLFHSHG